MHGQELTYLNGQQTMVSKNKKMEHGLFTGTAINNKQALIFKLLHKLWQFFYYQQYLIH